jgi:pyridoxal phosphate enzyme (YggS family)
MTSIASNLQAVNHVIAQTALTAGLRPENIALLAVSKTFPASAIREAYAAGQRAFGENYVQEALDKITLLSDLHLEWHFIGPIQSNKTRAIAENFCWIHGVDRLKIAERLSAQRPHNLPSLNICLQVNVSEEESKSGVAPDTVLELAQAVARLPRLRLRGLMAIPAPAEGLDAQLKPFALLRQLLLQLNAQGFNLDTLSMGMSHDFEAAIREGATIVRVGSAIFGNRNYHSVNLKQDELQG